MLVIERKTARKTSINSNAIIGCNLTLAVNQTSQQY